MLWRSLFLTATTLFQLTVCLLENRKSPPGEYQSNLSLEGSTQQRRLHLHRKGIRRSPDSPVIVVAHSLGGVEGYLLLDELAQLGQVVIYDRAGYGWSDISSRAATAEAAIADLDAALSQAQIEPPYLLVGDSLGSYHVRLYAHQHPEKVAGLVLIDGLHEAEMLAMPWRIQLLKLLFWAGFVIATLGSALGLVSLLQQLQAFEIIKPELRSFSREQLAPIKRSMARPKHWFTMAREIWSIDRSGRQLQQAAGEQALPLKDLPIISIKSKTFFHRTWWTGVIPLRAIDQLRDRIHNRLAGLSSRCETWDAPQSSHFVWTDEPEIITQAVAHLLNKL